MFLTNSLADTESSVNSIINSIFNAQIASETLTLPSVLLILFSALILGALIGLVYIWTQKKNGADTSLSITATQEHLRLQVHFLSCVTEACLQHPRTFRTFLCPLR